MCLFFGVRRIFSTLPCLDKNLCCRRETRGGGGWGGGDGGAASWGGGAVDGGSVNAFLSAALMRVMRAAVSIPALASASVLHSAAVGGSVVGVVGPL